MTDADSDSALHVNEPAQHSGGLGYWLAVTVALLTLVLLGAHAYQRLKADVEQRRAVVQGQLASPIVDLGQETNDPAHVSALPALTPAKPDLAPADPVAPAVVGQTVYKCLQDGRLTYTNKPCPEGSAVDSSSTVPSTMAGASAWSGRNLTGQHASECGFLQAEIERLEFEFRQPLSPPVIDHISTELGVLRQKRADLACP